MLYDALKIPAPVSGMNMNLDEESLPSSNAASLVNFIPDPLGAITLRNGTQLINNNPDKKLANIIPFSKKDGSEDYFSVFLDEITIQAYQNLEQFDDHISFDKAFTEEEGKYFTPKNNFLLRTQKGIFVRKIKLAVYDENAGQWTIYFETDITESLIGTINQISFFKSVLYHGNTQLYEFIPIYRMRGFPCMGKMLLATGADPIQVFDEDSDSVSPLQQEVDLTVVKQGNDFRINNQNYPSCHLNKYVYVLFNNIRYDLYDKTNESFKLKDANDDAPVDGGIFKFIVYPGYSSFCTVIGNRLWILGEGGISPDFKERQECLLSYYSWRLGELDKFLSPVTGLMPSLELSGVADRDDSLDRIEQFFNYLVFFGKKAIYFYNGLFPDREGAFSFAHSIPIGLYHPEHLQKVGNDIIFSSDGAFKKLSTLNVAKQTEISDINGLDPFLRDMQADKDFDSYLYFGSAFYDYKKQLMFKFGTNAVIVFSAYNNNYIPYLYTGDFKICFSIAEGRNCIYLCIGEDLICYQEEKENITDVISNSISFTWKTPTYSFDSRPFASQKVIFNADCDPQFSESLKDSESNLFLGIYGIHGLSDKNFSKQKELKIDSFGDFMDGFSVKRSKNYGTLEGVQARPSFKLLMNKANMVVSGDSSNGRIRIKNLTLLGVTSRVSNA